MEMIVLQVALGVIATVVLMAVVMVAVSVACAPPGQRSRVAAQGARELRQLVESLLRTGRP